MTPLFAHPGHWAAQLLYLAPVARDDRRAAVGTVSRTFRELDIDDEEDV